MRILGTFLSILLLAFCALAALKVEARGQLESKLKLDRLRRSIDQDKRQMDTSSSDVRPTEQDKLKSKGKAAPKDSWSDDSANLKAALENAKLVRGHLVDPDLMKMGVSR